jgi:hypothetical protein
MMTVHFQNLRQSMQETEMDYSFHEREMHQMFTSALLEIFWLVKHHFAYLTRHV